VLNWANSVRIYSGDLSIEFSSDCADVYVNLKVPHGFN